MTKGKGGKDHKKTTSKGRKVKRLRSRFRWPDFDAETFNKTLEGLDRATNSPRRNGAQSSLRLWVVSAQERRAKAGGALS